MSHFLSIFPSPSATPEITVNQHRLAVTTSVNVADVFEKRHDNVLRDIKKLVVELKACGNTLKIEPIKYTDSKGRTQPMYTLTADAFALLAMGFTGRKALQFKLAFLDAFNAMKQQIERDYSAQMGRITDARLDQLRDELLKARPVWQQIHRYKKMGLSQREMGKLLGMNASTVRQHVRTMEKMGLLTPPANLATMQQGALRLGGAV